MIKKVGLLVWLATAMSASAVDSSGRNSHFWITLRPNGGKGPNASMKVLLANGYRRATSDSPLLSSERVSGGYRITWRGNNLIDGPEADTVQFNVLLDAGPVHGAVLDSVTVNGESAESQGLVVESTFSKTKPRMVEGKRTRKNYFEIQGSVVLRNPALTEEDPEHPFSDLKGGHAMGPTPYKPTASKKLKSFPVFSWDKVPRGMLIRKSTAYKDSEIKAIAENYDLVVLEKANGAGQGNTMKGMLHTAARLKKLNPDITILFYWNSRIFFGHYGIDDTIGQHMDEWISQTFFIRDGLKTYVRENPDFLKWWVGCAEKMIAHPQIDGTFVDKAGVPIYMLDALYKATPANKLVMNNNADARQRIGYVDGTYREGWSGGHNPEAIAETLAIARETGQNQKMQILRMPVKSAQSKQDMEDKIDRGLAIYLLYAEPYSYFYWQADVDVKKSKIWEWDASHVDQLNRPLGKPFGPYFRDNRIYTRSFEHCDVYLDLGSKPDKNVARIMWKNDIGKPALAGGGFSRTDNTYTLTGCGYLTGAADQFFFLSDAHYGDGSVEGSIATVQGAPGAKAGVMFRESLAPDAPMVSVLNDPSGRLFMVYRANKGAKLGLGGHVKAGLKPYVKITRQGDTFTGHYSTDGKAWREIAQVTVPMGEKVEMGMAVSSQDRTKSASAVFSDFVRIEPKVKAAEDAD